MQLATHVARVGAGLLGAKGAAQRRGEAEASEGGLLLAGRAETAAVPNASGKGHGQLEIHCITVSLAVPRSSSVGLRAVRGAAAAQGAPALRTAHTTSSPPADRGWTYTDKVLVLVHRAGALGGLGGADANEMRAIVGLAEVDGEGSVVS